MNIFLMGYMGCGKSTVGKLLAKNLNKTFIDLDEFIEKAEKISIEHFFEKQGEPAFRELEKKHLQQILEKKNMVVAVGGGTPCYNKNLQLIKQNGISVYLKMPVAALVNRLKNAKTTRPLLKNKTENELFDYIEKSLAERDFFYTQANYTVNGINLDIKQLITTIKADLD